MAFALGCNLPDLGTRQRFLAAGGDDNERFVGDVLDLAAVGLAIYERDSYLAADGKGLDVRPISSLRGRRDRGQHDQQC